MIATTRNATMIGEVRKYHPMSLRDGYRLAIYERKASGYVRAYSDYVIAGDAIVAMHKAIGLPL